jgi:hypothetical protein
MWDPESIAYLRARSDRRIALEKAPEHPATVLTGEDRALVKVRVRFGRAIAYTRQHVLVEAVSHGTYYVQWEPSWQVKRIPADEWKGEPLPD